MFHVAPLPLTNRAVLYSKSIKVKMHMVWRSLSLSVDLDCVCALLFFFLPKLYLILFFFFFLSLLRSLYQASAYNCTRIVLPIEKAVSLFFFFARCFANTDYLYGSL